MQPNVNEIGGSIQDFLSQVRAAFEKQFPPRRNADGMASNMLWIRDIYEKYIIVNDESASQLYKVTMAVTNGALTFAQRNQWEKVKLAYASEMIADSIVTEFKGTPPDVPPRAGVDLTALTEGDANPFFLTVEVSTVGRTSKNGLIHDDDLANALVTQINSRHAEGIMGHIKETDRATAFPVSDVHWLGAARHGSSVWAKGYIPQTATAQREHFRILKATNGRAATSITGPAVREFVDKKAGTWKAKGFQLEQLDLAPFTRAALAPQSEFLITREMYEADSEDTNNMDKQQVIAELRAEEIPAALREQIIREAGEPAATAQQLADANVLIAELQKSVDAARVREFESALDTEVAKLINWQVKGEEATKKVDAFRRTLRSRIVAELGSERDVAKVAETVKTVWTELQPLAETLRDALAGPPAIIPGNGRSVTKFEDTPEARQAARALFSF
jgi:hypothetical protein